MRKYLVLGCSIAIVSGLFVGCSSVTGAKVDKNVEYIVQFSGSDFNVGDVVTTEMPYDSKNPNMQNYEMARGAIDDMMNRCMQILTLCVNGADPETCEPEAHADCTGSCSSCGGGCH